MGIAKNRDLNNREITFVCLKIKEFYDHEKGQFLHGGRQQVKKRYEKANMGVSIISIVRYATEMRDHKRATTDILLSEAPGVDLTPNGKGKCGANEKLTPDLRDGYRKIMEKYAYSWRYLTRKSLQSDLQVATRLLDY